jgi:hypothetical protein
MVNCDHCGSVRATATDRPDCTRIDCPACGSVDFIWRDNEYEYEDFDPDCEDEPAGDWPTDPGQDGAM